MSTTQTPENVQARVEQCANCNAVLTGEFCAACGEHRLDARDLSLGSFLRRTFHNVTNIDATLVTSVRALVTRPGFLTLEYVHGRRRRYLKPLDLFLLVNLIYFLVQSVVPMTMFTTTLNTHLHNTMHRKPALRLVTAKLRTLTPLAADSATRQQIAVAYAKRFDANTHAQAKSLVILMVPLFALIMALLYMRTGKPAVQHLVFALHYYTWFLLMLMCYSILAQIVVAVMHALARAGIGTNVVVRSDFLVSVPIIISFTIYMGLSIRRAYQSRGVPAFLRTAVAAFGVVVVLFIYRMILFFTVFYTT